MKDGEIMSEIKLKPVLQEKVEEEKREKQRLKKQYGIEKADGVVVVEKVTIADKLDALFRMLLNVIVYLGFSVGLFCLIYPDTRAVFLKRLQEVLNQLLSFIN